MEALLQPILNQLLQAEMTEHLRAEPGERTDQRRGWRNGSYKRQLTTRVGTLTLEVPRDREGTFQTALFERYQRSEKALVLALMQMVVQGVSTRRVKKITTELCGREFSRQTVSRLSEGLDEQVTAWAERSLEKHEYPFLALDAMQVKVRRQGAVRSTTVLLAVGISEAGQREILGLEVAFGETGESWRRFIQQLKTRGLSGVEVATSDAHGACARRWRPPSRGSSGKDVKLTSGGTSSTGRLPGSAIGRMSFWIRFWRRPRRSVPARPSAKPAQSSKVKPTRPSRCWRRAGKRPRPS